MPGVGKVRRRRSCSASASPTAAGCAASGANQVQALLAEFAPEQTVPAVVDGPRRRPRAARRPGRTDRCRQGHRGRLRPRASTPTSGSRCRPRRARRDPARSTASTTTSSPTTSSTGSSPRTACWSGPWSTRRPATAPRGPPVEEQPRRRRSRPCWRSICRARGRCARRMPDALMCFLAPPSFEELERRLVGRGTEDAEERERRLATARDRAGGRVRVRRDDREHRCRDCVRRIGRLVQIRLWPGQFVMTFHQTVFL